MIRIYFIAVFIVGVWCRYSSIGNYKIYGGTNTSIEAHPWMVSVWWEPNYLCAGFLISPSWVLLNAQCVIDEPSAVFAGSSTRERPKNDDVYGDVYEHFINPDYYLLAGVPNNDIALLHLYQPLSGDNVKPIKLPEAGEKISDGTLLTVVGWGLFNDPTTVLKEVQMPVIGEEKCSDILDDLRYDHSTVLCLGNQTQGGKGPCTGDQGGPAEYNGTAVGVISFFPQCGSQKIPTFFTKISHYRDWIRTVTGI